MLTTPALDVTDALAVRYFTELHAPCPAPRKRRTTRECDWGPSLYCRNCGRPIPSLVPNAPGEIK